MQQTHQFHYFCLSCQSRNDHVAAPFNCINCNSAFVDEIQVVANHKRSLKSSKNNEKIRRLPNSDQTRREIQSSMQDLQNTVARGQQQGASLTSLFANLPPLQQRNIAPRIQVARPQLFVTQDGRIVDDPQRLQNGDVPSQEELARRCEKLRIRELSEQEAKESCSICISDFEDRKGAELPNCGHIFHEKCIKKWLQQKNSCPLCTQPVA